MDIDVDVLYQCSLIKQVARKKAELEAAVTIGEYWTIKCEIDKLQEQLKTYYNGCNV